MAVLLAALCQTLLAAVMDSGSCPAFNVTVGLQLGPVLPTTHCGANCSTSGSCCDRCAADQRCRAWVWRRGDPEAFNPLDSCKLLRVSTPSRVSHHPGDTGIVSGVMPPAPAPVPPPPPSPCSSHKTNATCPSGQHPPQCIWNATAHACMPAPLPCGVTKQKSIYLSHSFEPAIEDSPATDLSVEIDWNATADMMRYGRQTNSNPGIYAGNPIHTDGGISGYFGSQVHGGPNSSFNGSFLFSTWDAGYGKHARPADHGCDPLPRWAPNVTWCMRRHSFPLSANCHRHCQDCGLHPGWTNTTGTQCGVAIDIAEGDGFRLRLTRTAAVTTYEHPPGHFLNGSAWLVTAQRVRQRGVLLGAPPGPLITVGHQFWEGTFSGITRIGAFHEHIGCIACDAFYESEIRRGPWIHAPLSREANVSYTENLRPYCKLHSVEVLRRPDGSGEAAQIRTGPGCCSATGAPSEA